MAQVLVRNLDDDVVARLKAQAANENLSLEQFLRDVLVAKASPAKADFLAKLAALRKDIKLPNNMPPVEDIIRRMREDRAEHLFRVAQGDQDE